MGWTRSAVVAGAVLSVALVTGCTSTSPATSTTVVSPPTTTSAYLSPVSPDAVPLGGTQTLTADDGSGVSVTAYRIQVAPPPSPDVATLPPGGQLVGLDVQGCTKGASTLQSSERWSLVDGQNGRYEPDNLTYADLTPKYPYYPAQTAAGECIRGWIMFETLTAQPITTVRYTVSGSVLRWTVPTT